MVEVPGTRSGIGVPSTSSCLQGKGGGGGVIVIEEEAEMVE